MYHPYRIMNKLFLFLALGALLLSGCTNPTRSYHPLELPERSKGEFVRYEGATPKIGSTAVAYEAKIDSARRLFYAQGFCYDAQNDYLVFPGTRDEINYTPKDGRYFVVPRRSVKLCKDGKLKNNSYFSRHHAFRGATLGLIGGGLGVAVAALPFYAILSAFNASNAAMLYGAAVGIGTVVGGGLGSLLGIVVNGGVADDVQETCEAYFTREELANYLNNNLCF